MNRLVEIQEGLQQFERAAHNHSCCYSSFLRAAHEYDWPKVAEAQMAASANLEAAMDAFTSVCRSRQAMEAESGGA